MSFFPIQNGIGLDSLDFIDDINNGGIFSFAVRAYWSSLIKKQRVERLFYKSDSSRVAHAVFRGLILGVQNIIKVVCVRARRVHVDGVIINALPVKRFGGVNIRSVLIVVLVSVACFALKIDDFMKDIIA